MKKLKWNSGIIIIRIGYQTKQYIDWLGKFILKCGYKLRGEIPQKTWRWNHI